MLFLWFTAQDRDGQSDRKFDVILGHTPWHDVRLLPLDHALDPLDCPW